MTEVERIKLFIDMDPVGKGRPRITKNATFTPQRTKNAENIISWEVVNYMTNNDIRIINGPIEITLEFIFPCFNKIKPDYHTKKPDLDNLIKLVLDAMNNYVYKDDSQIFKIYSVKNYSTDTKGINISVKEILE